MCAKCSMSEKHTCCVWYAMRGMFCFQFYCVFICGRLRNLMISRRKHLWRTHHTLQACVGLVSTYRHTVEADWKYLYKDMMVFPEQDDSSARCAARDDARAICHAPKMNPEQCLPQMWIRLSQIFKNRKICESFSLTENWYTFCLGMVLTCPRVHGTCTCIHVFTCICT